MGRTFKRYSIEEFITYLSTFVGKVNFSQVHVHGTWRPNIADFRRRPGEYYIQSMYRAHLQRGFSDIAQHATIDPDGYIWDGRSFLISPASATGFNDGDNDGVHPFMFEMIGNFDKGNDVLQGKQLKAAVALTRGVIDLWNHSTADVHFHREFTDQKTCPGSGIEKGWFISLVEGNIFIIANGQRFSGDMVDGSIWAAARELGVSLNVRFAWDNKNKKVVLNGQPLETRLVNSTSYVKVREFANLAGASCVWNGDEMKVILTKG
jgi:hypothetical protein